MKSTIRKVAVAVMAAMISAGAFAALSPEYTQFGKGPAQWIMTKEEAAKWKTIGNDQDAKAFIDLFWARRDPTPATAVNEYRNEFERRVKFADENFSTAKTKGSMSDRGKLAIVVGIPTHSVRQSAAPTNRQSEIDMSVGTSQTQGDTTRIANRMVWVYERDKAPEIPMSGTTTQFAFTDQFGNGDWTYERGGMTDPGVMMRQMVERSIVSPNLTVAPTYAAAAPQTTAAPATATAAPAAPAVTTALKTAAYQTAINDFQAAKTNPYEKSIYATYDEFITAAGDYFVPISLYVPKSAGITDADTTAFGVVQDETGKQVYAFEEPAKLTATKSDLMFDKSLVLPAGKFKGTFGLAQGGKPVALVSTAMTLAGSIDKSAESASKLILSNNVYPLTVAQNPSDPYAFGGLKVIPKGDRVFTKQDDLWYFLEMRNPGLDDAQKAQLEVKLDITGTTADGKPVKMNFPPEEAALIPVKGVPGHYGIGNSYSLADPAFKPGSYTFKIKVTDKVTKQTYNVQDTFKIQG
jgi:GWxTD domain-containing protein